LKRLQKKRARKKKGGEELEEKEAYDKRIIGKKKGEGRLKEAVKSRI